nr:hypothetical protein [Tanacetum cinerariifolium]
MRIQRKETGVPHTEPQTKESVPTPSNDPLPSVTTTKDVEVVAAATTLQISKDDVTLAQTLIEIKATKPKARGVIVKEPCKFRTTSSSQPSQLPQAKDKDMNTKMVKEWSKKTQAEVIKGISKRARDEHEQESAKRQKLEKEDDTAELKRFLKIVPEDDDDVTIEATPLSSKSPTIMFKNFNRDDLEVLWGIVKERFKKTKPVDDMDNLLFQTLKTMFKHHAKDNI